MRSVVEQSHSLSHEARPRAHTQGRTRRLAHPKTIGLFEAQFIIKTDDVPDELKVGVFSKPSGSSYDAIVRFSGSAPIVLPDRCARCASACLEAASRG